MERPQRLTRKPQRLVMSFSDDVEKYETSDIPTPAEYEDLFIGIGDSENDSGIHSTDDDITDDDITDDIGDFIEHDVDVGDDEYTPGSTIYTDGDDSWSDSDDTVDDDYSQSDSDEIIDHIETQSDHNTT